ncbi:MAG: response regulator [Halobacteriovoraceae bacterium]|jgi:CheY-like chemotaxis protein|nr:response regulator [Halobacteriovoraceae bacterium]MBT5095104.1 response regulator [Halobacteriovoraceae bacterium]
MLKYKLFIIDDSGTTRKVIESYLRELDIEIHQYENPLTALEEVDLHDPKVILLDYRMPEINGDEFMIKLSEKLKIGESTTLLISGEDFSDDQKIGLRTLGVHKVIAKPIVKDELLEEVKALLAA